MKTTCVWIFLKFPAGLWEDPNPEKLRDRITWEFITNRQEAEAKAREYGLEFNSLWDTSVDKTVRMIRVDEELEDIGAYIKQYCDNLVEALKTVSENSGCSIFGKPAGDGSGGCGCGCGESTDSCKCGCCD